MRPRALLRVVLIVGLGLSADGVHAQPVDSSVQESERRFEEGRELFRQRRYAEARVKFLQACAADRTVKCPKNLGSTEYELGLYPAAATHLGEYLRHKDFPQNDPTTPKIRKWYDEALAKTGHLQINAPPGAEILADDQPAGKTPLADLVYVAPGTHNLKATLADGRTVVATTSVEAGQTVTVPLMPPEPAPSVSLASTAPTPPSVTTNSVGPALSSPSPSSSWNGRKTAGVVVIGAGLIALGTGIIFGAVAGSKASDGESFRAAHPGACINGASSLCAQYQGILSDQGNALTATRILVPVGAVVAIGGAVLLLWPTSSSGERAWLAPSVGRGIAGLNVGGRF
jgi:hypothetical protein